MFISPEVAIKEGWITHPNVTTFDEWKDSKFVSPNAIDFTVDKMFTIAFHNQFVISEKGKQMRGGGPYLPIVDRASGMDFWKIKPDAIVDCLSDMYVTIPDGVACQLIIRSTFSRNGLFLTSGIYDSGFAGHIGFGLHNPQGATTIAPGTRIGQIIFVESTNALSYAGGYNHVAGTLAHQE
jgi:deoxycytidine triphosphate deaminase